MTINQIADGKLIEVDAVFLRYKPFHDVRMAQVALSAYRFPGNIRELENLVAQLYVFHDHAVSIADLPLRIREPAAVDSLKWEDAEKLHIQKVMRLAGGNKSQALKWLGYGSINTLQTKLQQYGLAAGKA